jgi:hypothetical protein
MALHVSPLLLEQARRTRSLEQARADRRRGGLRLLTGDAHPLYLSVFRHRNESGRCIGNAFEDYRGETALSRAADDAQENVTEDDGRIRYESTIRLNTDGSFDILDLSERR